jgi:nucleoside phosphorylase/tetratricopeptide (TPR) repeat protein
MLRAVIFVTLSVEYAAVRKYLSDLKEKIHPRGTIYEQGRFVSPGQTWDVRIVQIGAGNSEAALEAERAIAHFNPDVIFFVGVAGGIKDVQIGDVVASTKIYGYESGKAEQEFRPRPEIGLPAYCLEQRAKAEARTEEWLKNISPALGHSPRAFVAPIAAGEKVIASTKSKLFQFLCSNYSDAVAVEMEGWGFLEAARANHGVLAIVIRGISDLIDNKADSDRNGSQATASRHASAFAFAMLSRLQLVKEKTQLAKERTQLIKEKVRFVKEKVNTEPSNLPHRYTNKFIGRKKEIHELLTRISDRYRQHLTVLKGIGGVGKTSLVLEVAYMCWEARKDSDRNPEIPYFDAIIFSSSKATDLVGTKLLDRPEKEPTLADIFRIIAETLNEPIITQVPIDQQADQVRKVLEKRKVLLIVDNMETLEPEESNRVLAFLNNVPSPTQVIVTTREHLGIDSISINTLTKKESLSLISEQAKVKMISIKGNQRKQIYKRFGGIPIALIYAIGQRAAGYSFSQILKPTISLPLDLGRFCFDTSVQLLRNTDAYKLLLAITFFRGSCCRESLVKVAGLSEAKQETMQSIARLLQLSLIYEQEDRYSILPITREYAISELEFNNDCNFQNEAQDRWIDWYLKFTRHYGGDDLEDWRARYDCLDKEWMNIESVLYFCAAKERWSKVMEIWQNIDNYVDLSGYWQKRRHWWALLASKMGSIHVQVQSLAQKAWTMMLMGTEHHPEAGELLKKAWDLRESTTIAVQASIANYLSLPAKAVGDFQGAHEWLDMEQSLLKNSQLSKSERIRLQTRNFYYRAETYYLQGEIALAKRNFQVSIEWGQKIGWQRFINYAQNSLGNIFIEELQLQEAEKLLKAGLLVAENMRETRRIALYNASFARLYYAFSQVELTGKISKETMINHLVQAKRYGEKALVIFSKESMLVEEREIQSLLVKIAPFNSTIAISNLTQ